ncbi:YidB family protein [Geminicoccus harenae]|uniref:YidB family protein n=1 Tax=Geminicoccus harenae TaxID=2498453 RepID=UPI00168AD54C|nr:YidB family protein [Geminicoccus harenae]
MSRGMPSMAALLGLLAVAGFQNRDKLAEMFGGTGPNPGGADGQPDPRGGLGGGQQGGLGGLLGGLFGDAGTSGGADSLLRGGLGDLVDRFKQTGHGDIADSWVSSGPNREVVPHQLGQAIGPEVLASLTQHTGLSREELLSRLTRELPSAVDNYTPNGRLPS